MTALLRLSLVFVLSTPALAYAAVLENPSGGNFYSGIGVISGWKCEVNGPLTVRFDGGRSIPLLYGSERLDTRSVCGDANNGFVSIWNWGELGDGTHTAVVYDNGVEFARSTFEVATLGEEFVVGAMGECTVSNFPSPGETATLEWNEATQHLEVVREEPQGGGGDDHGDTLEGATRVELSSYEAIHGTLTPGDVDFFQLTPTERGGWIRVETEGTTNTRVAVLDSSGMLLERDSGKRGAPGLNFRLTRPVAAGTYYYIRVSGSTEATTGAYVLQVLYHAGAGGGGNGDRDDHGDTPEDATRIGIPSETRGHLTPYDVDFFEVTPTRSRWLRVETTGGPPIRAVIRDEADWRLSNAHKTGSGTSRGGFDMYLERGTTYSIRLSLITFESGAYVLRLQEVDDRDSGGSGGGGGSQCDSEGIGTCEVSIGPGPYRGCWTCGDCTNNTLIFGYTGWDGGDGSQCRGYGGPGWQGVTDVGQRGSGGGGGDGGGGDPGSPPGDIEDLLEETEATCGRPYRGPTDPLEHARFHCMYAYYLQCHNFTAEHRYVCDQVEALEQLGAQSCPHC